MDLKKLKGIEDVIEILRKLVPRLEKLEVLISELSEVKDRLKAVEKDVGLIKEKVNSKTKKKVDTSLKQLTEKNFLSELRKANDERERSDETRDQ